jgi:hypothetical protein
MSELHLFIIWEKATYKQAAILADLQQNFRVLAVYKMIWSPHHFSANLSRFYGQKLLDGLKKERHCGRGPFTLAIFEDEQPTYKARATSRGSETVNTNTFDAKERYRSWTGGGHKIHGTNSPKETAHDLTLLLGINPADFSKERLWDGRLLELRQDLIGAEGWKDLGQLFQILNHSLNYLVLRNFEGLPGQHQLDHHGDIDLLTDNYTELCFLSNAQKIYRAKNRVHFRLRIADQDVPFDFRYVGDNYYDARWQQTMLEQREWCARGFYIPNQSHYFYSLLYHALIHKADFAKDYQLRLEQMAAKLEPSLQNQLMDERSAFAVLKTFMTEQGHLITEPNDLSVFFNSTLAQIGRPSLRRKLATRSQTLLQPGKRFIKKHVLRKI